MHCSVFDGNYAADGAAMNVAHYSAKFDNVTFSNNTESAIRVSLYCICDCLSEDPPSSHLPVF